MEELSGNNTPIMTGRMWVEFGKMYNAIVSEGYDVIVETVRENFNTFYSISVWDGLHMVDESGDVVEYLNPYIALKELYFRGYLGIKEWEDIPLDFDNEELDSLYKLADQEGITIDEFIINVIKEMLVILPPKEEPKEDNTPIEVAECCYTCDYIREDFNDTGAGCVKLNRETEYQKKCKHYTPATARGL